MPAKKELLRKYRITDSALVELSLKIELAAQRDLAQLSDFGYNQAYIDDLKDLREAFLNVPTDEYYSGVLIEKSDTKNTRLTELYRQAKGIALRFINQWGETSPQYRRLRFTGYLKQTEGDQYLLSIYLHSIATAYLAQLAGQGLMLLHLDALQAQSQAVLEALLAQWQAISDRDFGVHLRIETGNALFNKLSPLADAGLLIWRNQKNEANYNDYLRYANLTKPGLQSVEGTVAPLGIHHPAVTLQRKNQRLEFTNTGAGPLLAYLSDNITGEPNEWTKTIPAGQKIGFAAVEMGYSLQRKYFIVRNTHPNQQGTFVIRF